MVYGCTQYCTYGFRIVVYKSVARLSLRLARDLHTPIYPEDNISQDNKMLLSLRYRPAVSRKGANFVESLRVSFARVRTSKATQKYRRTMLRKFSKILIKVKFIGLEVHGVSVSIIPASSGKLLNVKKPRIFFKATITTPVSNIRKKKIFIIKLT